jgi:predicted DNA-binding protein YlxM (UPF0122 family)
MLSQASQRLADDHAALDDVLSQLRTALEGGDVADSHAKLDLFWARLAVHIRAEHLHLFPTVLGRLTSNSADPTSSPTFSDAETSIEQLRADHDFFMHELAQAIGILRDLKAAERHAIDDGIRRVRDTILEIEKRLIVHNEIEENQIYCWVRTILNAPEQADLATLINAELANRPPRFSAAAWSNR